LQAGYGFASYPDESCEPSWTGERRCCSSPVLAGALPSLGDRQAVHPRDIVLARTASLLLVLAPTAAAGPPRARPTPPDEDRVLNVALPDVTRGGGAGRATGFHHGRDVRHRSAHQACVRNPIR